MSTGDKLSFYDKLEDWFDAHPSLFLVLITALAVLSVLILSLLWGGCPQRGYRGNFLKITPNNFDNVAWVKTPKKTQVWAPYSIATPAFYQLIDQKTDELEKCLKEKNLLPLPTIHRDWFAVYVPKD